MNKNKIMEITKVINISEESSKMLSYFLNLIWNHYVGREGIKDYYIAPNKDKEMIATITFIDEEKMNLFFKSLDREVKYKIIE